MVADFRCILERLKLHSYVCNVVSSRAGEVFSSRVLGAWLSLRVWAGLAHSPCFCTLHGEHTGHPPPPLRKGIRVCEIMGSGVLSCYKAL